MKESYYFWKKILINFYDDILKRTLIMLIPAFLIVVAVSSWRYNLLAYILAFLICFSINYFNFFRKYRSGEIKNEFKENQ